MFSAATAAALVVGLSACSGGSGSVAGDRTPEQMLDLARTELAAAQTVQMSLETTDLPSGVNGLVKASGTATKAPAFEGTINVAFNGFKADVKVRALDGKVWAIIPGSTEWSEIDPAEYGAPDPATLIDDTTGFGGLLGQVSALKHVEDALEDGEEVAVYSGVITGEAMKKVMPSSDASGSFAGTLNLDDDGELVSMSLTGPFYAGESDLTYTVRFTDYDDDATPIQAPTP